MTLPMFGAANRKRYDDREDRRNDRDDRDDKDDDKDNVVNLRVPEDGAVRRDLGAGDDLVKVRSDADQIRLTFTSSEVGNGNANDSNTMTNQDGGLAVRLQAENGAGGLTGPVSRFDDEGITFEGKSKGLTFDVRDLVSGAQRGDQFDVVTLGTRQGDLIDESGERDNYYINAGMGDDTIKGGDGDDFLVGGAGNDLLKGNDGEDTLLGGGGNDTGFGGKGDDVAIVNASTDGADSIDLGRGEDVVRVSAAQAGQVRLTFTSAEVGNGNANDSNTMLNQDGGLAVRFQLENGSDGLVGPVSRYDDENIEFRSQTAGLTFDVRDLVAGTQRGDRFEVVRLGSEKNDTIDESDAVEAYYINAGMGNDDLTGGSARDFLVGGGGNDTTDGGAGQDSHIGGGGNDVFDFSSPLNGTTNVDRILDFSVIDDLIRLNNAVFTGLPDGPLAPGAFALSSAAGEADDRIIYNQLTGDLSYDANGGDRGDAVAFANLVSRPTGLTAADFFVI